MAGRSHPFVIGAAIATVLVLGPVWHLWGKGDTQDPRQRTRAAYELDAGNATSADDAQAAPHDETVAVVPRGSAPPGAEGGVIGAPDAQTGDIPAPASRPPPDEGPEASSWRKAKVAFGMRELGRMGPYVKTGLEAARREMEFCFRQAQGAPAPVANPDAPSPPADPAVLLLYLEAREGAIDVIDTRMEHRGTAALELVDCCREVLRGLEIPAFNTTPGQRYRVKYQLE